MLQDIKPKLWANIDRRTIYVLLIAFICVAYLIISEKKSTDRLAPINYYRLHNSEISGRLEYIDHRPAFIYSFRILGDTNNYTGHFIWRGNDWSKGLQKLAEVGDSMMKYKFSDTLILIKENKIYYYEISKPAGL